MKTYKLFLCIIGLLLCVANPISAQKVKDGFKGFEWGTEFLKMDSTFDLLLKGTEDDLAYYTADISTLAGVKVEECVMIFYEGRFFAVMIITKIGDIEALLEDIINREIIKASVMEAFLTDGGGNFNKMLLALTAAYGGPITGSGNHLMEVVYGVEIVSFYQEKEYDFSGPETIRTYEINNYKKTGELIAFSVKIHNEMLKKQKKQAKKYKDDF